MQQNTGERERNKRNRLWLNQEASEDLAMQRQKWRENNSKPKIGVFPFVIRAVARVERDHTNNANFPANN